MPDVADPAEDGPERQIISLDERRKVWEALGALSDRDRTALVLRESQGLSNAEVAESLSLRWNAAEVLLFRARQRFRQQYIRSDERPLTCGVSPLHLSAFIDDELKGQACWDLEAHLQCCSGCRDWLATMESGRKLFRGMGLFAVPGSVTAAFHTKILALVGESSVATSVPLAAAGGDGATAGHPSVLHRVDSTPDEEAGPGSKAQAASGGDQGSPVAGPSEVNLAEAVIDAAAEALKKETGDE